MVVRDFFESDIRFYHGVGLVIVLIFVAVLITGAVVGALDLDRRLIPLLVGFSLFMIVYFVSVLILLLKPDEA